MVGPKVYRFWNVRMNMELMSPDKGQHDFDLINSRVGLRFPHQIHWTDPTVGNISWWCLGIPNVRHSYIPFFFFWGASKRLPALTKKARWEIDWKKEHLKIILKIVWDCMDVRVAYVDTHAYKLVVSKKKNYREVKVSKPSEWGAKEELLPGSVSHISVY